MKLLNSESVDREVGLNESPHMLSTYKLGRSAYTSLRHDLKQVSLSAHHKIMLHKNSIMPTISSEIDPAGVTLSVIGSVKIHFQ